MCKGKRKIWGYKKICNLRTFYKRGQKEENEKI